MNLRRRQFIRASLAGGVAAGLTKLIRQPLMAGEKVVPVTRGPEVEEFKKAQDKLLKKYQVSARSRYLKLNKPALTVHVLEAGKGKPIVMLHGGGLFACQFAPLISGVQKQVQVFAV